MLAARNRYNSPFKLLGGLHPWSWLQVCLLHLWETCLPTLLVFQSEEMWACGPLWSYGVLQPGAPQFSPQAYMDPHRAHHNSEILHKNRTDVE